MKIKSARYFREKYMTDIRHVSPDAGYDPSFVGCNHMLPDGTYTKGFFDLFHGDKQKVPDFLSNFLKIAEDGQAIYEFLQNAADCNSTLFYMFYDEKYFFAVNNGKAFTQEGLRSLLNVAQSTKSTSNQIGRFGIGFKLVHRLVGKGDGMRELTQDYKGPIMFSWNKKNDIDALMNNERIECENNIDDNSNLPYLLKLILTNFPAELGETVKDLNYQDRVLFDKTEYNELSTHVKSCLSKYLDIDDFNQGSLFFIRLGEGKKELLDKDYEQNLKTGVEYSLNTLKGLNNVKINGIQIEKVPLKIESGIIPKESETFERIDPEYKDSDIHFSIGYNEIDFTEKEPFKKVEALKKSPTFYKYFPLGDEIHQSAIFIHCDSLSNEANRRKMHEDAINKALIPEIAKFIVNELSNDRKLNNSSHFCQLYANLLLSDTPHDNSDWLKESYYDIIQDYLVKSIPTLNGFTDNAKDVKIKRISTNIPLSVINDNYQWFKWYETNVGALLDAAREKLNIKPFDIIDLIVESDISRLNSWISSADDIEYKSFLNEINSTTRSLYSNTNFREKIRKLKLFKFSDKCFHSYDEIVEYRWGSYAFSLKNTVYKTYKTEDIYDELISLGFIMSEINLDTYQKIKECFPLPKDLDFFRLLESNLEGSKLSTSEKRNLITHLTTQEAKKKLEGVGDESIRSLRLCHNKSGQTVPLRELIGRNYKVPFWLSDYQIEYEEYFPELDKFLMPEKSIYDCIIFKYWDDILPRVEDVKEFYWETRRLYSLDIAHNKVLTDKNYIYTEDKEFVSPDDLIYNSKMLDDSLNYKSLNNIISSLFNASLPNKSLALILNEAPFGLRNENICNWKPDENEGADLNDVRTLLKFCALNNETFFKEFVIEQKHGEYFIESRSDDHYQVYVKDTPTKSYIEDNYGETMILLPKGLEEFKDSEGIVSGEELYSAILDGVEDVDSAKEDLIDILKYESRKDFILNLSEIRIDLDEDADENSFCYKLLDTASKVISDYDDILDFRNKLIVIKNGDSFTHDQIPQTITEKFKIEEAKHNFDLSKILPNENGNGSLLMEISDKYSGEGIPKNKLNNLLGISKEPDIDSIYETLIANYDTLQNEQQLAFVLTYCSNKGIDLPPFKLIARDNNEYDGDFMVENFDFIDDSYVLSPSFKNLKDYIELPYGDNTYISSPYIDNDSQFICPGLNTSDEIKPDFTKIISLLEYLEKLCKKDKENFKSIDWSEIQKALAFNPEQCVYPSQFAIEEERLPEEVEEWVEKSAGHIKLIESLGVLTTNSTVVKFRQFLNGSLSEFNCDSIYAIDDIDDLENSLAWASEQDIFPLDKDKYYALIIAINQINKDRETKKIAITDNIDTEQIEDNCIEYANEGYEEWKEETGHCIHLYEGSLPHIVELDEYINGTVFSYSDGDIADNGEGDIYINKNADIQEAMHHLADNNDIQLTREEVYRLFNHRITDLQNKIKQLEEDNP